jgi:hypothetical protein
VEDCVELEMRGILLSFASIRRNAAARLAAIKAGAPERFQDEQEFGWLALKFVADSEMRAEASYLIAALAVPADRARFALIPEARSRMADAALALGFVRTSDRHRIEIRA